MRDLVVIGGGSAGLAAALSARKNGIDDILILERADELGGILNQCIHNGFGLHTFKEELTGPEYANRFIEQVLEEKIEYRLNSMVIDLEPHKVTYVSSEEGLVEVECKAIVLAMGCRERSRGALNIPGYRPAGVFSAGTAQKLMNIDGERVGKRVVILGSGDIGLIMARRLTLEGAEVLCVAELMPYSGGLKRNIVQCLDDYGIPLLLSHTVVKVEGKKRVEGIVLAEVDERRRPIPGTEKHYDCDTLLLSVGLLPENELSSKAEVMLSPITGGPVVDDSLSTSQDGIFACGNVLHVHDLVDYVSEEARFAGASAARYIKEGSADRFAPPATEIKARNGVRYTVPSFLREGDEKVTVRFRVGDVFKDAAIKVSLEDGTVLSRIKRPVLAPGEMEKVTIDKTKIPENCSVVYVEVER